MSRTTVTPTAVHPATAAALVTVAADVTNGHSVPLAGARHGVILELVNSAGGAKTVTVKATNRVELPGYADLAVSVPAGDRRVLLITETARHLCQNGDAAELHLDLESGFTGTLAAAIPQPS